MTLEEISPGERVFIDAPIFVYHFTGVSESCKGLLERCETREITGMTSAFVVAEVAHRLMTIVAVREGLVTPGNVVKKLRNRPEAVKRLKRCTQCVGTIPLMAVEVGPVDLGALLRSREWRERHGLLVNDSLVVQSAVDQRVTALATADRDFERVEGLEVYRPGDLPA